MNLKADALHRFSRWFQSLRHHATAGGPARGTIAAALVVLERIREDCNLDLEAHKVRGGSQIQGASGPAAAQILARYGESRPFLREGGRTNRGGPGDIESLLAVLRSVRLCELSLPERLETIDALQVFLVDRVREWHERQRLTFSYDPGRSAWQIVNDILLAARAVGKEGAVAQYLVGAKLQSRFPHLMIDNYSFTTSDAQRGRAGDFQVGDTVFHVTVSPMTPVYERCRDNLLDGLSVYLIVPGRSMEGSRQIAESTEAGRIFVQSIEAFVGANLDEMAAFDKGSSRREWLRLLNLYNDRAHAVELDPSMKIEIPRSLSPED